MSRIIALSQQRSVARTGATLLPWGWTGLAGQAMVGPRRTHGRSGVGQDELVYDARDAVH